MTYPPPPPAQDPYGQGPYGPGPYEPQQPPGATPPPYGYQVPPGFGGAPPPSGGGGGGYDPLVPEPYGGLQPLWDRLRRVLSASGKQVLGILFLTFALPQIAISVLSSLLLEGLQVTTGGYLLPAAGADGTVDPDTILALTGGVVLVSVVVTVVMTLFQSLGWCAAIWTITQTAAGQPVAIGDAFRAGARRLIPMFGWFLLVYLMFIVGLILCILPGLYLAVSCCLFSFVVMYERGQNPIGRSFQLVHRVFGAVLGRFCLLLLFLLGVGCVLALVGAIFTGGIATAGAVPGVGSTIALNVVNALVNVLVYTVMVVGLLLTYTQVRARMEPLSTAALQAGMHQSVGSGPPGYPYPYQPA